MEPIKPILGILLSYTCGAIPFGILVTKLIKGIDVRDFGSGSSGFTNVYRVGGLGPGLVVALLDVGKGLLAVAVIARGLYPDALDISIIYFQLACGCFAVIGHIFTIFARFRGGKGVLTALGVCVGLMPLEVAIAAAVFAIMFAVFRYISVGSLAAAASLPVVLCVEKFLLNYRVDFALLLLAAVLALLIFYAHRENIRRLIRGEENRFNRVEV